MAESPIQRKQYYAVDIMKFIMALFVVVIHRAPFYIDKLNVAEFTLYGILVRFAVPFFFCASAFLLFEKLNKSENKDRMFLKYIGRLSLLYVLWSAIYFPASAYRELITNKSGITEFIKNYVINFFIGSSTFLHLWYLPALIYGSVIVYLLVYKLKLGCGTVAAIGGILFFVFTVNSNYSFLPFIGSVAEHTRISFAIISSTVYEAVPFISAGFLIGKYKDKVQSKSLINLLCGISIIVLFIETFCLRDTAEKITHGAYFTLFPSVILLLLSCVKISILPKKIYTYMRKMSILIYFTHLLIFEELFNTLCYLAGIELLGYMNWFRFAVSIAFSLIISALIVWLSEKKKFRFLKYLY